jgi:hypothetical protein
LKPSLDETWPSNGDLHELGREAQEHRRAWALVGGLSRRLLSERIHPGTGPSTEEQAERIHQLEEKIVKQRKFLAQLEECREFERETERLLVEHLDAISHFHTTAGERALRALDEHTQRKGPRPEEES